jgi:membrane-bound lytic murein transglycosylase F
MANGELLMMVKPMGFVAIVTGVALCFGSCADEKDPQDRSEVSATDVRKKTTKKVPPAMKAATLSRHPKIVDTGDLKAIQERGYLRVIVPERGEQALQNRGLPLEQDRELATGFAKRIGVDCEFIWATSRADLLSMLEKGEGDLVAAQLTATDARKKRVAFTRPTAEVSEWIVGPISDRPEWSPLRNSNFVKQLSQNLPPKGAFDGMEIHVRKSSAYAETLASLQNDLKVQLKTVDVPENIDTEQIVYEVGTKKRPYTVVDSNILETIESYNPEIGRIAEIAIGRQIGWAIRKSNPNLKSAADGYITEQRLTGHTRDTTTGDLDLIQSRGVLRVLTRNNPITYFLYRGEQMGFEYELMRMAAKQLGLRLEVVVPPDRSLLIPWLNEGRGDIIAASLTVTPERKKKVAFTIPYFYTEERLVQRQDETSPVARLQDLRGKTIHVRESSSYFSTLQALQKDFGPFTVVSAPEKMETAALINQVIEGTIPLTVADQQIIDVERTYGKVFNSQLALNSSANISLDGGRALLPAQPEISFAVRAQNTKLKGFFDRFIKKTYRGLEYNMAKNKYFKNKRHIQKAINHSATATGQISPYDNLIKKYSKKYGFDWRLMAAQAFQESRFRPDAKSWVGARGLFQVMPATGAEMGFKRLENPEIGTHAGIKYMSKMLKRMDPSLPFRQRVRFALAAYNAGWGHVMDARRLAAKRGWDPNRWFGNVEKAMVLLEQPRYYKKARYGYCRGSEPVTYVSNIQLLYDNYVKLFPN